MMDHFLLCLCLLRIASNCASRFSFLRTVWSLSRTRHFIRKMSVPEGEKQQKENNDIVCNFCIVGAFDDDEVIHVDGEINPVRDFETIRYGTTRIYDEHSGDAEQKGPLFS